MKNKRRKPKILKTNTRICLLRVLNLLWFFITYPWMRILLFHHFFCLIFKNIIVDFYQWLFFIFCCLPFFPYIFVVYRWKKTKTYRYIVSQIEITKRKITSGLIKFFKFCERKRKREILFCFSFTKFQHHKFAIHSIFFKQNTKKALFLMLKRIFSFVK